MKREYSRAIREVARREGVRPEVVYTEIQKAIEAGYTSPDPEVQAYWRKIAPDGAVPTPEQVIEILSREIKSTDKPK
jgi:transposase-like protein